MLVAIDGLIGQYGSDCVSMQAVHAIAAHSSIWHQPSASRGRVDARRHRRSDAAADPEAEQEHGEDERERVDRRAEEQREDARPDHLGAEGGHAGERDGDVDGPRARRTARSRVP